MNRHVALLSALCGLAFGFLECTGEPVSTAPPTHRPIRLACVGDSLTSGFKMEHPKVDAYPAQLASQMGEGWEVRAFAVPGRTALRKTDRPLWTETVFADAQAWQPEEVILCLGTNDSWPDIWHRLSSSFPGDYRAMVDRFASLPSHPRIWLCLPPPLFIDNGGEQKNILTHEINPIIQRIAAETGCGVIDWHAGLLAHSDLFMADKVHPLPAAAAIMAQGVADAVRGPTPLVTGSGMQPETVEGRR